MPKLIKFQIILTVETYYSFLPILQSLIYQNIQAQLKLTQPPPKNIQPFYHRYQKIPKQLQVSSAFPYYRKINPLLSYVISI